MNQIIPIEEDKIKNLDDSFGMVSFSNEKTILEGEKYSITIAYPRLVETLLFYDEDAFLGRLMDLGELAKQQDVNWQHNIFKIENSTFIEKINENNDNLFKYLGVAHQHYFICSKYKNNVVELILVAEPQIIIEPLY